MSDFLYNYAHIVDGDFCWQCGSGGQNQRQRGGTAAAPETNQSRNVEVDSGSSNGSNSLGCPGDCNAYTGLQNGLYNIGYQELQNTMSLQRDFGLGIAGVIAAVNTAAAQQAQCCCDTKQILLENRYLAERSAANTDASITAQIQSVKDMLCAQEAARKDARIWQLELNQASSAGSPKVKKWKERKMRSFRFFIISDSE